MQFHADELANFICQTPFNKLQEATNVLSASLGNYKTCEFLSTYTVYRFNVRQMTAWTEQMRILFI